MGKRIIAAKASGETKIGGFEETKRADKNGGFDFFGARCSRRKCKVSFSLAVYSEAARRRPLVWFLTTS
jgi:hypothetical protein